MPRVREKTVLASIFRRTHGLGEGFEIIFSKCSPLHDIMHLAQQWRAWPMCSDRRDRA